MTTHDQKRKTRNHDELATSHTGMLRVLQSKTLPANTHALKIVTKIHAGHQIYTLESYRDENDQIGHSITTSPADADKARPLSQPAAKVGA